MKLAARVKISSRFACNFQGTLRILHEAPGRYQRKWKKVEPPLGSDAPCRGAGQFIAAVVVFVRGMTLRPIPDGLVPGILMVEFFPKILILHGLLVRGFPAASLPAVNPGRNALP